MLDLRDHPISVTLGILALPILARKAINAWLSRSQPPLPPGPKGYPIIGNLLDIGEKHMPWKNYSRLANQYGDIMYLEALGTKVLVLSSVKVIEDLLEGRSSIYSDRPHLPMLHGQMKFDLYFANMRYGSMWRRQRRLFHQHFNHAAISRYHPVISNEATKLVRNLSETPEQFSEHIGSYLTCIIVKVTYGFDISGNDDSLAVRSREIMKGFSTAGVPGTFLVDLIPALVYLPSWLPGTSWKKVAEFYRNLSEKARNEPYQQALRDFHEAKAEPSVASRLIEQLQTVDPSAKEEEEIAIRDALGVAYIAGFDSSLAAARTFVLLMVLHPQIQKRAQDELDDIVGPGQTPSFEDLPKLVYLDAVMREVFRWHREAPLAVPHATSEDDVYNGYFIPKGTIVLPNSWHILGDPNNYANPSEFIPERHLKDGKINPEVLDPYFAAFGYGRRGCPGKHFALDALNMMAASILAAFDLSEPKDAQGKSAMKWSFNTGGVVVSPNPYGCVITPRRFAKA